MNDRTQRALGIARRTAHQHAFDRFADGGEVALPQITVRPDDPQPPPEPPPDDQGYWSEPYTMQPGDPYDPLAASAGVAPSGTPSIAQKAVDWWKAQPSWLEQAAAVHKQSDPTSLRPSEAEIDFASGMVGPAATEAVQAAKPFYSAVEQAVGGAKMNAAPAQQWLGTLRNAPGVKPEELDWLGVPDFLQGKQGPIAKQDLLDHIANNKVDVQEVMKGAPDPALHDATVKAQEAFDAFSGPLAEKYSLNPLQNLAMYQRLKNMDPAEVAEYERLQHEWIMAKDAEHNQNKTKFGTGMGAPLPGGENYRELLLTMPNESTSLTKVRADYERLSRAMTSPNASAAEIDQFNAAAERYEQAVKAHQDAGGSRFKQFTSSHWEEPNVLAHVRFDDRVVNGDRTLHMAEIQSDWHQKGRREGYQGGEDTAKANLASAMDEMQSASADGRRILGVQGRIGPQETINYLREMGTPEAEQAAQRIEAALDRHIGAEREMARAQNAVPDAPFKTTWPELALKRMIRYAAENGYDRISWDSGATNAERYDLSKQIDSLQWRPDTGELIASKGGAPVIDSQIVPREKLADMVGKEAADRLLASEPTQIGKHVPGLWHSIEGNDLKVGGEGMKGFYDKMLPTVANKLGKKYGARVDAASLPADKEGWHITPPSQTVHGRWMVKSSDYNSTGLQFDTEAEAQAALASKLKHETVHTLKLTPELRKAALQQGFPMFARGGKVTASQMARRHAHQHAFDRTFPR